MPSYPDYYLPDGPKKPSFWQNVKQIIKRDWPILLFMAIGAAGWAYIYIQTHP